MQNGLFTSVSHSRYVILFDRPRGGGINNSQNKYGIFDIYNKRIYGKHMQFNDIKHTVPRTTTRNNNWR